MHPLVQLASRLRAPDLVRVVVGAGPDLDSPAGSNDTIREVDTLAVVGPREPAVLLCHYMSKL